MQKIMGMSTHAFTLKMYDGTVHNSVFILNARDRAEATAHMNQLLKAGKRAVFFTYKNGTTVIDTVDVSMAQVRLAIPH